MQRPKITSEFVAEVAAKFCEKNRWSEEQAADLADAYDSHMDGYELAKALESNCYWDISVDDVETLDTFGFLVGEAHRKACLEWAQANNIQPPFPVGTMTTRGEITGVSEYDGATYLIREPNEKPDSSRRLLVKFEDVRLAVTPQLPEPVTAASGS